MAYKLTLDEITEYKAAFSIFDKENKGKINSKSVGKLMRSLGQNLSKSELNEIKKKISSRSGGDVEFHEFLEIMVEYRKEDDNKELLIKAFKYFDRDETGKIDWNEFTHTISCVADKLSPNKIKKLEEMAAEFLEPVKEELDEENEEGEEKRKKRYKLLYPQFIAKILL